MKKLILILLLLPVIAFGQIRKCKSDSTLYFGSDSIVFNKLIKQYLQIDTFRYEFDTIRVIFLVSDTTERTWTEWLKMNICDANGNIKTDSLPLVHCADNTSAFWIKGYAVYDMFGYMECKTIAHLDSRKQPLRKSLLIWNMKRY